MFAHHQPFNVAKNNILDYIIGRIIFFAINFLKYSPQMYCLRPYCCGSYKFVNSYLRLPSVTSKQQK